MQVYPALWDSDGREFPSPMQSENESAILHGALVSVLGGVSRVVQFIEAMELLIQTPAGAALHEGDASRDARPVPLARSDRQGRRRGALRWGCGPNVVRRAASPPAS